MQLNTLDKIAYVLIIIGGINWGFVGWLKFNLLSKIFGSGSGISTLIYMLVGLASLYIAYKFFDTLREEQDKQRTSSADKP